MKRYRAPIIMLVCLAAPLLTAEVQEPPKVLKLDLKTAVDMGLAHSYSLKGSMVDLEARRTAAQTSWSGFYPSASLSGSMSTGNSSDATAQGNGTNGPSLGANLGFSLNAKIFVNIKQLWNDYASGAISLEQARLQLAVAVKKYYWSLVVTAEQLDLLKKQGQSAAVRFETAAYKYQLGLYSEMDKLTVEYTYKALLYNIDVLQNSYQTGMMQFRQVLGVDPGTEIVLVNRIPDSVFMTLDTSKFDLEKNLDLALLRNSLEAQKLSKESYMAGFIPSLSLGMGYSLGFERDPLKFPLSDSSLWGSSLSFKVSVSVPLDGWLPWSSTGMSLAKQDAAIRKTDLFLTEQRETVQLRTATLVMTLRQIESQIASLSVNIRIAEKNLSLVEQLYTSGKKSYLDLKDAENNYYDATIRLINAKYGYLTNLLDLQTILNADLGA